MKNSQLIPLGSMSSIRLQNKVVTTGPQNATYLFDVTTYDSLNTPLESWSEIMVTTPPTFPVYSASSLCWGDSLKTVISIIFSPQYDIPNSIVQTSAFDTKGFIEFEFLNSLSNLGFTWATQGSVIPCRPNAGLVPISGKIACNLYPGSASVNPVIRVTNFQAISSNVNVSIDFPGVKNPTASGSPFQVIIKTVSLYNRIRTQLNLGTVTLPVNSLVARNESGSVSTSAYVFSSTNVGSIFNLQFNPGTSTQIYGPGSFILEMPYYDIGWVTTPNTISCKLGAVAYPCTRYDGYGADWMVIPLTASQTFISGTTISLNGLQYPRYQLTGIAPNVRFISSLDGQEYVLRP